MTADVNTVIRLIVDGEERVVRSFNQVGRAGQQAASALSSSWRPAQASMRETVEAADRMAASLTATQGRIEGMFRQAGRSAAESASAFSAAFSIDDDIRRLEASLDPAVAALQRYENAQETVARAVAAGRIEQARANEILARAQTRMLAVDPALGRIVGSSRQFGAAMQQAGFQVGDFAVQLASGQNAVVAFTQQGAQLAGAFGPWGAIIGAAGAVVGALSIYLLAAGEDAATLEERTDDLGSAISGLREASITGGEGIRSMIEHYGALNEELIEAIQNMTRFNVQAARRDLRSALGGVREASGDVDIGLGADDFLPENASTPRGREFAIEQRQRLADEFGIGVNEVEALQEALASQRRGGTDDERIAATRRLNDVLAPIALRPGSDERLQVLGQSVNELILEVEALEEAEREAAESLELLSKPIPELAALAAEDPRKRRRGGGGRAFGDVAADLAQQIDRLGLSERDQFIASATDRLSAGAGPQQIEQVRQMAADLFDLQAAIDSVREAEKRAATEADRHERELDSLAGRIRDEVRPEAERYVDALTQLEAVQDRLSPEEFRLALADIRAEFDPITRAANEAGEVFGRIFDRAIANAENFGDVLDIVRSELRAYAVDLARTQVIQPLLQSGTDALSGAFSNLFGSFAFGGGFTVPGAGGHDSVRAVLNLTPGERVDISRPGEDMRGIGGVSFNFYGPVGDSISSDPAGALAPAVAHIETAFARTAARGQRGL